MEKIFKTDNGEIKFESKNGSIKISQGENFMKFNGAKAPSNVFENDIETFISAEREDLGECSAISLFDTLLNFYSIIAEYLGKIEVFCKHFIITDYVEWLKTEEIKITIAERTVKKTGETVTYELEDKLKIIFDRKANPINIEIFGNIPENKLKMFFDEKGNPINVETFGNVPEKELKEVTEMIKNVLFSK
jgi:hypothetical protein